MAYKKITIRLFLFALHLRHLYSLSTNNTWTDNVCRDREGFFTHKNFRISSCSMCYFYLFQNRLLFYYHVIGGTKCLFNIKTFEMTCPDVTNQTTMTTVCDAIDQSGSSVFQCADWKQCCQDAWTCCEQQSSWKWNNRQRNHSRECPQTWDGWKCWNFTQADTSVQQPCPSFLDYLHFYVEGAATVTTTKFCTENGTWYTDSSGQEKTDFSKCGSKEYKQLHKIFADANIVGLALNSLGITLLVPALGVFFYFRQLRRQQRIKIHMHFFIALLGSSIVFLLWDVLVVYNSLNGKQSLTKTHPSACKALNMLRKYGRSCLFFWMLCEGYYLHKLLIKSFEAPKYLITYYITGWGVPLILSVVYAILRVFVADDNLCWEEKVNTGFEWIFLAPNFLCIGVNFFLLVNILRILIRQLSHHKSGASNLKQALKALLILIPLFGVDQFFILYIAAPEDKSFSVYKMSSTIVYNSQGIVLSLLFCFLNGEVHSLIRSRWRVRRDSAFKGDTRRSLTQLSNVRRFSTTSMDSRHSRIRNTSVSSNDFSPVGNAVVNGNVPVAQETVTNGGMKPSKLTVIRENSDSNLSGLHNVNGQDDFMSSQANIPEDGRVTETSFSDILQVGENTKVYFANVHINYAFNHENDTENSKNNGIVINQIDLNLPKEDTDEEKKN